MIMEDKPKGKKVFSWTIWKSIIDAGKLSQGENSIMVRAVDSTGKV
jgi:hypothetical protein